MHGPMNIKFITMYFTDKFYKSVTLARLPEDGPGGPNHVGANIRHFNVKCNILYV